MATDYKRIILAVLFSFSAFMLLQAWQKENTQTTKTTAVTAHNEVPANTTALPGTNTAPPKDAANSAAVGKKITLSTDVLTVVVNTLGGVIERVELKDQPDSADAKKAYRILANDADLKHFAESGLIDGKFPNHKKMYVEAPGVRELAAGQDTVELVLTPETAAEFDASVEQVIRLKRGSHVVEVMYRIKNTSAAAITPTAYFQLVRDEHGSKGGMFQPSAYTGPLLYSDSDKYKKIAFADIDKYQKAKAEGTNPSLGYTAKVDNGWIAMVEHYFVAAWLPGTGIDAQAKRPREFYTDKVSDGLYSAGVKFPVGSLAPGASTEISVPLYLGPQEQDKLKLLAPGLELVVDYGKLTIVAEPLFWLLKTLHGFVGNWGFAIILLTLIIKAVFFPLSAASARSMGRMKLVQPKLKEIQERNKDDKQKLNVEMMELYRKEKINPMGGCLPMIVQIPVFLSLYWVLLGSVELRHAPFAWIQDLSQSDPWFILPVLYALTAWAQVKLQPPSPGMDPTQAKMMQYMPLMFAVMFVFFPAGLVLYWFVQNVLTIAQQWHMNRVIAKEHEVILASRR